MALSALREWVMSRRDRLMVGATVLTCLALAVALLPPDIEPKFRLERADYPEKVERQHDADALSNARIYMTIAEMRDQALAALRRSGTGTAVWSDPRFPAELRSAMDSVVRAEIAALKPAASHPVAVAIALDTNLTNSVTRGRRVILLPQATDGQACVVTAIVGRVAIEQLKTSPAGRVALDAVAGTKPRRSILGPCAFYASFGAPGPNIQEWLSVQQWAVARRVDWTRRLVGDPRSPRRIARLFFVQNWFWNTEVSDYGCSRGLEDACASIARAEPPTLSRRILRSSVTPPGVVNELPWWVWQHRASLLSDMVYEMGPDRFARFWHSPKSPADAYRDAMGESFASFATRWGRAAFSDMMTIPVVRTASLAWSFGLMALGLALALLASRRRAVR